MRSKETIIKTFFLVTAFASVTVLGLIMLFLLKEGLPIFGKVSVKEFLFSREWYPTLKRSQRFLS